MKQLFTSKTGFTLAELMAVVAIIAILSAVALGSYRKAMERTIFNEGEQMVHALAASADAYYADNLTYPTNLCQLDITIPNSNPALTSDCTYTSTQTKNFKYTIVPAGPYVEAESLTGVNYTLRAYMEADGLKQGTTIKQSQCRGNYAFCSSVGYTKSCDAANQTACVKY